MTNPGCAITCALRICFGTSAPAIPAFRFNHPFAPTLPYPERTWGTPSDSFGAKGLQPSLKSPIKLLLLSSPPSLTGLGLFLLKLTTIQVVDFNQFSFLILLLHSAVPIQQDCHHWPRCMLLQFLRQFLLPFSSLKDLLVRLVVVASFDTFFPTWCHQFLVEWKGTHHHCPAPFLPDKLQNILVDRRNIPSLWYFRRPQTPQAKPVPNVIDNGFLQ